MLNKHLIILFTALLFSNSILALHRIDSLKQELAKYSNLRNDSLYNVNLKLIVTIYKNKDVFKGIKYANNGLELALKKNNIANLKYWYGTLGDLYLLHDEQLLALESYKKGIEISKKMNHNTGWWLVDIGNVYFSDNLNLKKAENSYLLALNQFSLLNDEIDKNIGKSVVFNNLGLIEQNEKNYEKATQYFKKALILRKLRQRDDLILHSYSILANAYITIDVNQSKLYFDSLYHYIQNNPNQLQYYLQVAALHRKTKEFDQAILELQKAEKIAIEYDLERLLPLLYQEFTDVYIAKKQYDEAIKFAEKGLQLTQNNHQINYALLLLERLIRIANETKSYQNGFEYQKKYIQLKSDLHEEELKKAELNYELEENTKEIKFLKNNLEKIIQKEQKLQFENYNQHQLILQEIWAIVLLLIAVIFIFWNLRKQIKQKKIINDTHKEFMSSINYSKTIQRALLPKLDIFDYLFNDYLLIYRPKDVLSGDFYQLKISEKNIIIAIADCTGHGVPGAMLSVLGINFFNDIIKRKEVDSPADVLEQLNYLISSNLQTNDYQSDGMDIAICTISKTKPKLTYAGAYINLYLLRNGEIIEYKSTRSSVGINYRNIPFENNEIQLQKGDKIFIFTDGFSDQLGGIEGNTKKFSKRRLLQILIENQNKSLLEQKKILLNAFEEWKQKEEQTDDITIFGIEY